jgi:D-3-phosphoglycerate dehydrogenase / 2-oxoglutarate reductase
MKPVVLLFEPIHEDAVALLRGTCEVRMAPSLDEEALLGAVADVDALIIRAHGAVTRRLMEHAPRLKVIGRHGVGLDAVDLPAAQARGIAVVYTPEANTESVAEQCLGFMLVLAKRIIPADRAAREARWSARYDLTGSELREKTLGLIGFGRIGRRLAEMARAALRMDILYWDHAGRDLAPPGIEARRAPLDELLGRSDVISVHVPLRPETRGMIGAAEFARMKPTALFLNTARGPIVDEPALIAALREGRIAGAGLDVYATEPLRPDNPLLSLDNVVLSPHMSAHTGEALRRMAMVAEDVHRVLRGERPVHCYEIV